MVRSRPKTRFHCCVASRLPSFSTDLKLAASSFLLQHAVPDWDPNIKQKAREPAPWGNPGGPETSIPTSSYSQHYQKWPSSRMPNFKPNRQ